MSAIKTETGYVQVRMPREQAQMAGRVAAALVAVEDLFKNEDMPVLLLLKPHLEQAIEILGHVSSFHEDDNS
jgi:hypothetical protein